MDADSKHPAAPNTSQEGEIMAAEEKFDVRFICSGNRPHFRDPSYPLGHARNPVPPAPLSEQDWLAKLHRKLGLPPPIT